MPKLMGPCETDGCGTLVPRREYAHCDRCTTIAFQECAAEYYRYARGVYEGRAGSYPLAPVETQGNAARESRESRDLYAIYFAPVGS